MAAFQIKPGVALAALVRAYDCKPGDPLTRPLRVYAVDPGVRRANGALATIQVPYEPLSPGPIGKLFEVECADGERRLTPLDLENPRVLIGSGITPSVPNLAFHQQMVYAVASNVYATFRSALGRLIAWGYDEEHPPWGEAPRLRLRPHVAAEGVNAAYDKMAREIRFGYADDKDLPGGRAFACLSHDIIAHEMTHALIDGLRSRFTIPTNPDVLGFHEGLADLVAVFNHFLYPEVLATEMRRVGPRVEHSHLLTSIAENFGLTTLGPDVVRTAIDADGRPKIRYSPEMEAHEIGRVLVLAVFEAFLEIFRRKTERYRRLAGPQVDGFWPEDLIQLLAEKAAELARNFLAICIRAIDYCPPIDMRLGEYLRALVTADANLVASDPWGYREALIAAFADHGLYPAGVLHLSEDALAWRPPDRHLPAIPRLSFNELRFDGDPSRPASAEELNQQAAALGAYITHPRHCDEFGLTLTDAEPPCIQSIRTARRVGPDGQIVFDLIAEVTQRRTVIDAKTGARAKFLGGSTIIIGPRGEIRYVISKNVLKQDRLDQQLAYQRSSRFWRRDAGQYRLAGQALLLVRERPTGNDRYAVQ